MAKSVEGIIGKQIGFDKLGELEVMPSFKGEMRKYPANYEIIRGAIQEEGGGKEQSQNTEPAGDPAGSLMQGQCCRAASRGRHIIESTQPSSNQNAKAHPVRSSCFPRNDRATFQS